MIPERSYQASDMMVRSHLSWLRGWLDGAKLPADVLARVDLALEAEQEMRDRLYDLLGERCTCPPWQPPSLDCVVHVKAQFEAARELIAANVGPEAARDVPDDVAWTVVGLRRKREPTDERLKHLLAPYRRPRPGTDLLAL